MSQNKLKIFLSVPGHLKTVPMNLYVYKTFKNMGYEVELFDFSASSFFEKIIKKISKNLFFKYMNNDLISKVSKFKPDIFLTIFGFDHDEETLKKINNLQIKTVCWWLNDPFQVKRSLKQAKYYDYYFTNSNGSLPEYKNYGIKNIYYLPVGCFPDIHKKEMSVEKKYNIIFAGDHGPVREEVMLELIKEFDISIFGPWKKISKESPINKHIVSRKFFTPEEMTTIFNQSKIVLNIHSWFGKSDVGINPRVIEANGCGSFQISDFKEEIPALYDIDKEIVIYNDIKELKDKIRFYLDNDKLREQIAENAYSKSLSHHTYDLRMKEMISIITKNKG